jgi:alanyl-tRNA synthetase
MKKEIDPRMHSAEHILNQTMVRMFRCGRSMVSHIEKKKSKCDYRFSRPLTEEEARGIEEEVNHIILAGLSVSEETVSLEEAEEFYDLDRLPDEVKEGIRIVKIGEYDACPCIGRHVHSTDEIGEFKIVSTSFAEGVLRIRFKLADP